MKRLGSLKLRLQAGFSLAVVAATIYAASATFVTGADTKAKAKSEMKSVPKTATKTDKKKLDGAQLYSTHCNRCHAERYATERTDAQWKTLMMHMQTRAQLPGKDAKAILKYLQENN